jgi:5-formyltetrahydrofolate cyclo-ligase
MTKQDIRRVILRKRRRLSIEWIAETSRRVQERACRLPSFASARLVCGYLAMRGEVETDMLFARAREAGKRLCVPAFRLDEGRYGLAELAEGTVLSRGPGGVREPREPDWVPIEDVDLMVVPGLAFDRQGGRVGYGKGHYDALLATASWRPFPAVGFAFGFQLFRRVPVEAHDVRLDAVITEQENVCAEADTHQNKGGTRWSLSQES